MNRNTQAYFAQNPQVNINRSKFKISNEVKLSGNVGNLIPFEVQEVLPGDTFKVKTSKVIRLTTPVTPFMDNLYADFYHFFVPNRLIWSHWQNFMGESEGGWIPETEYEVPVVEAPEGGWLNGTIADYMGIPTKVDGIEVSALPFRAMAKIYDDWFKSTALQDPVNIPMGETKITGSNSDYYVEDIVKGGLPPRANKAFDYFTGALPSPQRGDDVELRFDIVNDADDGLHKGAHVFGTGKSLGLTNNTSDFTTPTGIGLTNYYDTSLGLAALEGSPQLFGVETGYGESEFELLGDKGTAIGVISKRALDKIEDASYMDSGLYADLSGIYTSGLSINELRSAFQVQKWFEKLARGGDRYISILKSFFGVTSPDARLQRSEYLGGSRVPITVSQVLNTNGVADEEANGSSPLGSTAAYSLTVDTHYDYEKSFVEHGYVISLMVLRYDHTYQQGINKMWSRKTKFDYYWPVFANIGEQAILNQEILARGQFTGDDDDDDKVFGYQEAWADYRYKPSRVAGQMRSNDDGSLDSWHFADYYNPEYMPTLCAMWLEEDSINVDRVLSVSHYVSHQFFADIYIENEAIRPMPVHSIPGLIDHH